MTDVPDTHQKNLSTPSNGKGTSYALSHALMVGLGIFLSRISGLIRNRVFAYYLGNSVAAGAFRAALRIPNFLQNLFGEGVLSASFIPVYSRLLAEGKQKQADQISGVIGSLLAIGMAIFVLLGVLFTPLFVDLIAPGFTGETRTLTIELVRILFPGVGLLVLSAWCLGVLNSHRKFFLSYAAPVVWNGAMIAALIWGGQLTRSMPKLTIYLAWGAVVGAFLQFFVQLPSVYKLTQGSLWTHIFDWRRAFKEQTSHVREILRNSIPIVVSRGVVQVSAYIDSIIGSFLGASAISCLGYAQTIFLLPVSLFGMSVAAAELPDMSGIDHNQENGHEILRNRIAVSRRQMAFFVIPSAVVLIFLGQYAIAAIYQTGHFKYDDTLYVWYVLMGWGIGLSASTWSRLYQSAFYALRDTKTPLIYATARVSLATALGLLLAFPLRSEMNLFFFHVLHFSVPHLENIQLGMGALGLTVSAGLSAYVEFAGLHRSLAKKIGRLTMPYLFLAKVWLSALIAAVIVILFARFHSSTALFFRLLQARPLHYDFTPAFWLAVFGILYLLLTWIFRVDEARKFLAKVLR